MPASHSLLWLVIAAVLAPLLSIVIFSGVPLYLIAFRQKAQRGLAISFGGQQKVHCRANGLVDSSVKVNSGAFTLI